MNLALTLPRTWQAHVRRPPMLPLLYATVFPVAAVLITAAFWPMWQQDPFLALGNEFLSLALVAAGLLLCEEPVQQGAAIMLIAAAALLTLGWVNRWKVGPLPLISVPASPLGIVLAGWAMFRYPYLPSEMRRDRRFFVVIFVWFVIGQLVLIGVSRPAWNHFPVTAWWPTLYPDRPLFDAVSRIIPIGGISFAAIYMGLWLRRWRSSRGITRRLATPIAIASAVVCAAMIAELIAVLTSASERDLDQIYEVEAYLQIGVPLAFAVSVMRRRFARTRIVGLLLSLQGPARLPSITSALRSVFEDPQLEIVDWPFGNPGGRLCLPITSSSGEHLHDGTQQRLLGLKIMLAAAEADISDGAARAVVSRIRTELGDVLDELRDLAHGIHPAVLSPVGLAQAVLTWLRTHHSGIRPVPRSGPRRPARPGPAGRSPVVVPQPVITLRRRGSPAVGMDSRGW